MSRSCHSATFSSPTSAADRTTRASPQMRSETTGFRLCGIADEPFCPRPNGSSTSRTSVRARWRTSSANFSSDAAASASALSSSACRSRWRICVDVGAGSSPRRSHAIRSTSGSVAEYVPTAPESFPTRSPSSARSTRVRSRSSSNAQPASFSPNVVGSACTPCVRPIVSVIRCSSARRDDRGERAVDAFDDQPARLLDLQRERRVEHVGGRQPVVEPAPVLAEPLGDGVDERRDVVVRPLLDLAHALRRRRDRGVPDRLRRLGGHAADLGPRVERGELHLEPALQLSLLRPDPGHRRTGVAGNHRPD